MVAQVEVTGGSIVYRRPHFRRVKEDLFFLISRRPFLRLSSDESAVWDALGDASAVDELRGRFPEVANRVIARFLELGLCDLAEPKYSGARRRIIVFEPHSDDAVLSVGGTMWMRRHDHEFIVVTIASRSNYTSYYELEREFFNVEEVSSLRNAEGALFARLIGGQHRPLGQLDAPLRYRNGDWSLDWFRRHKPSILAFVWHPSGKGEHQAWTDAVRAVLRDVRAEEVWIPLGGPHTDHRLARNACLRALVEDAPANDWTVRFYQEVPYGTRFPEFTPAAIDALGRAGIGLIREDVPIGQVFEEKLRLTSIYASQFKVEAMRAQIEASAREAGGEDGLAERFWCLERPFKATESLCSIEDDPEVHRTSERLSAWARRHRRARRIRMLLLAPAGLWAEDMEFLLLRFPQSQFDVYASPADVAVASFASPRIRVRYAGAGAHGWKQLCLRLSLARPLPTLLLAGQERLGMARCLAFFWPLCDPLVLPTMEHLVLGLRQLSP